MNCEICNQEMEHLESVGMLCTSCDIKLATDEDKKVLDKVKTWLEDEIKANEKYGDDPTNTAKDLLTKINDWENKESNND